MPEGDFDDRMAQFRTVAQNLQKDGALGGVELEIDPIRGVRSAYLSATASATADLVYTVPAGKALVVKDFTLTNNALAPATITIRDNVTTLDTIIVAAQDSVVISRSYYVATSIVCLCSVWLLGTTYSFAFYEFDLTNRNRTPPN